MENDRNTEKEKLGCFPFVVAILSFIPLFGVLVGLVVIVWGIAKWKQGGRELVLLGSFGIFFTIVLYGSLFGILYHKGFIEEGGIVNEAKVQMAQAQLNELVRKIEYYKITNGEYPESLKDLIPENQNMPQFTFFYDPFVSYKDTQIKPFNYGRLNNGKNYFLSSSGPDRTEGTDDDIFPKLSENELGVVGYIKD